VKIDLPVPIEEVDRLDDGKALPIDGGNPTYQRLLQKGNDFLSIS
jgi:hypothetical protein